MRKPNFFIVGAPKCGTTSLAAWLADHPQIFFCPQKEPHFFNLDSARRGIYSLEKYERLFDRATADHIGIGEGSTNYLYSKEAISAIRQYNRAARFIAMVRNPIDMAYSLHGELLVNGDENIQDFEKAWRLQDARSAGRNIPKTCADPHRLFYGGLCKVGQQLERLFDVVPKEKVLLIRLENVIENPRAQYLRVLEFLGVGDDGRTSFPAHNSARERRFRIFWQAMKLLGTNLHSIGIRPPRNEIFERLRARSVKTSPRSQLTPNMRRELSSYFESDIILLEQITGWDLTHWKDVSPRSEPI